MRYSKLIGKTLKQTPKDEEGISAQLLVQAGYIRKEIAGAYIMLPLGLKVLKNIEQIIREEMNALGGQEMQLTALQNPETWKRTGRFSDDVVDNWFKTELKNGTILPLAITHEEPLTELISKMVSSYKDLPLYPFQFQTKFRNELRARGGLLRVREFLMKDLYSFSRTQAEHDVFYEKAKQAYIKIWDRLGIGDITYFTFASGGSFSKFSHEFQTITEAGEDTIYVDESKKIAINKEVYEDEIIKELGLQKEDLVEKTAIEVGNIFPLGTKFSKALNLNYIDEEGEQQVAIMGSYGIGIGRVMATIVEVFNDKNGIIWPENVAPYKVHLISLNTDNENILKKAESFYNTLIENEIEVLYDDRENTSAGEKFAVADLIGLPYRLVISEKSGDKIELKKRKEKETKLLTQENLLSMFSN